MPFHSHKLKDFRSLQRLGARYPWTHANTVYPQVWDLSTTEGCREWGAAARALCRRHTRDPPRHPKAWVLKDPAGSEGKQVQFLRWDVAEKGNTSSICQRYNGWIVQQMVHSTRVFRGGSVFAIRGFFIMPTLSPAMLLWSRQGGAWMFFADRPGQAGRGDEQYLTNLDIRQGGEAAYAQFTAHAPQEFNRLKAGMWEECFAPQLKVAAVQ